MTNSNANHGAEAASTRGILPEHGLDLPAVVRQVRLCRSTLGAILDELECDDLSAGDLERLAECTTGVTGEIEILWEAVKRTH